MDQLPPRGASAFLHLICAHNTFLAAETSSEWIAGDVTYLRCKSRRACEEACFLVLRINEGQVALQVKSGKFVRASRSAAESLLASSLKIDVPALSSEAVFRVKEEEDGTVSFGTQDGGYLSARDNGAVTNEAGVVAAWERFTIVPASLAFAWNVPKQPSTVAMPATGATSPIAAPSSTYAKPLSVKDKSANAASFVADDPLDALPVLTGLALADATPAAAMTAATPNSAARETQEATKVAGSTTKPITTPTSAPEIRVAPVPSVPSGKLMPAADAAAGGLGLSSATSSAELVAVFWDIENCMVPKDIDAFDVVGKIRELGDPLGKRAWKIFEAFGDVKKLSPTTERALHLSGVKFTHVAADSKNKADFMIIRGIQEFTYDLAFRRESGLVMLISSDVNFAPTLQGLRSLPNVKTVVIHGPASRALRDSCDEAIQWSALASESRERSPPATAVRTASADAPPRQPTNDGGKPRRTEPNASLQKKDDGSGDSFECNDCSNEFASFAAAKQHVASTGHRGFHKAKPSSAPRKADEADEAWECSECKGEFGSIVSVKHHQAATGHRGMHKAKPSSAPPPPRKAGGADDEETWECNDCNAEFGSIMSVKQHHASTGHHGYHKGKPVPVPPLRKADNNNDETWECNDCNAEFSSIVSVKQHHASTGHHGYHKGKPTKAQPRKADANDDETWECNNCNAEFGSIMSVKQHHASTGHHGYHHKGKPAASRKVGVDVESWECNECKGDFSSVMAVKQHQASTGHRGFHRSKR